MKDKDLKALRLMEELDGLDDAFIEDAMLPDEHTAGGFGGGYGFGRGIRRFMNSGLAVALLAGVLSLSLLGVIVRLGQGTANDVSPDNVGPAASDTPSEEGTPPVTMDPPTTPDEEDRVEPGTTSVDEYGLIYRSNGDGTCVCKGFVDKEGQTVLRVPNYSPDGDVVVELDSFAFRTCFELTEVILPDGLRRLDHNTFPMEIPIYSVYGNILYLPGHSYPYMAAVATIDNRPGHTSPAPGTRIIACHAFTYDVSTYFALHWRDQAQEISETSDFVVPSSVIHIGEYGLTDVGRPITYNGFLVGWDALTAESHADIIRTPLGEAVPVKCLDGTTVTRATEPDSVTLSGAVLDTCDGTLYGGYLSYAHRLNPDYYAWLQAPESFETAPDQFITFREVFGTENRVLTPAELSSVVFSAQGSAEEELMDWIAAYNTDPAVLYKDHAAVMILQEEQEALYSFRVSHVEVTQSHIHVIFEKLPRDAVPLNGRQFVLVPVHDPSGRLQGASVSYEILDPPKTAPPTVSVSE